MKSQEMAVGSKWGHLTLSERQRTSYTSPDGSFFSSHGGPVMWTLICDCGHTFAIEQNAFPGKKVMRSCGREECSAAALEKDQAEREAVHAIAQRRGRPRPSELYRNKIYYMPDRLITSVEEYARKKETSNSRAICELVDFGLAYQLLQGEEV